MSIQQITPDLPDEKDPNSIWNKNPDEGKTPEEIKQIEEETCLRGKRYETFLEAMRYFENLYPNLDPLLIVPAVMWEFGWDDPDTKNKDLERYGKHERNVLFKSYGICRTYNNGESAPITDISGESGDSTDASPSNSIAIADDCREHLNNARPGAGRDKGSDSTRPEGRGGEVGTD